MTALGGTCIRLHMAKLGPIVWSGNGLEVYVSNAQSGEEGQPEGLGAHSGRDWHNDPGVRIAFQHLERSGCSRIGYRLRMP